MRRKNLALFGGLAALALAAPAAALTVGSSPASVTTNPTVVVGSDRSNTVNPGPITATYDISAVTGPSVAGSTSSGFDKPVRLTPLTGFGGFEPSLIVDHANNVWVTAHKTYYGQISPDLTATLQARSASWLWVSPNGVNFTAPPGGDALNSPQQYRGDEADLAVDGKDNVYAVDLGDVTSSFNAWSVAGPGQITHTTGLPAIPGAQAAVDRPWVAAGGDGTVLILQSASVTTDGGQVAPYVSHDGGKSLATPATPVSIPNSHDCRPLVDRTNSMNMLITCSDGSADLFSVSSRDGGVTWAAPVVISSTVVGGPGNGFAKFTSLAQAADGSVYMLYTHHDYAVDPKLDPVAANALYNSGMIPSASELYLFHTTDLGKTWSSQKVTPSNGVGIWDQVGLAASPKGPLGFAGYFRPNINAPWQVRAAVFMPGSSPYSVEPAPGAVAAPATFPVPEGDFTQPAFGTDGKFRMVYALAELSSAEPVLTDTGNKAASATVYYVQQAPAGK